VTAGPATVAAGDQTPGPATPGGARPPFLIASALTF